MIAIVYFSETDHTRRLAEAVAEGAGDARSVLLIDVTGMALEDWQTLDGAETIVFGAPTHMGSIAARFDTFLEQAATRWDVGAWTDKMGAGFTVAVHPSGDKLQALIRLSVFAAQMGMVWVGQSEIGAPVFPDRKGINRDGSWIGLMATEPVDADDLRTARLFGGRIAATTARWCGRSHGSDLA